MRAEVYWIEVPGPGRLAIMPHPGGDAWLADELRSLKEQGATLIVSLQEEDEAEAYGLKEQAPLCAEIGLRFRRFPIQDHSIPPLNQTTFDFIDELVRDVKSGEGVAVHCMAGIGRSGLICISVLIALGMEPVDAMNTASNARGLALPETDEQCLWLRDYAQRRNDDAGPSKAPQ
jgi:protein-tyrosine phosphatase